MPPAIPRATYRLQLSAEFGFDHAAEIVPYLQSLGISHLYTSPFMKARTGSQHGYDITDHNVLNPEFGGEEGFANFAGALKHADLGLILDFVPNHMGVGHSDNGWWMDVLEWGPKSPFATMFDIDWATLPYRREGGVLLPILGKPYGEALEQGELKLKYDADQGSFAIWYFDHRLPYPENYSELLKTIVGFADAALRPEGRQLLALAGNYSNRSSLSRAQMPAFRQLLTAIAGGKTIIEVGLALYRPTPEDSSRVAILHRLIERQHYRLAHWRVAISEINYRRFFDINDLAGIRVEELGTFRLIHHKIADLIFKGQLQGIRLDHIDGLYDPAQYCLRLQRLTGQANGNKPVYTVVEKNLAPDEGMLKFSGVAGTTGYDALNLISRVLAKEEGLPVLEQAWQTHAAPMRNFQQIVEEAKLRILEANMASEFTVLVRLLSRIAAGHWPSRDFTLDRLRAALELFVVNFPVYRTYIAGGCISDSDRAIVVRTIAAARDRWYGSDGAIFDFLQDVLTLDLVGSGRVGYSVARVRRFAAKMQQFTGPVTAKAVEDTAFYRYHRLLAFNEVGNDPASPALTVDEFHQKMALRERDVPHAMTATATHDTKRGEDARARLIALTEIPDDWSQEVHRWTTMNAHLISQTKPRIPSRAHEYMLYQSLIGAWPDEGVTPMFVERMQAYAIKAAREGKQETSWTNPNEGYEEGLRIFVASLLDVGVSHLFLKDLAAFTQRTSMLGALNSISQLTLKATIPGVPDFYQGTEFGDFSLVDPDNRRAVDFTARIEMLARKAGGLAPVNDSFDAAKFALTRRLLEMRSDCAELFAKGRYQALATSGTHAGNVMAFVRVLGRDAIIVAVGRHFSSLTSGGRHWLGKDTVQANLELNGFRVVSNKLYNVPLDASGTLPVGKLFADVPVAIFLAHVA